MTLVALDGTPLVPIGPLYLARVQNPAVSNTTLDAAAEAQIYIGRMATSDGGSHTIDTTGSSSIGWRTGTTTFADGSTVVKVGIASVDAFAGPPARATHVANVITFDVNASFTGGGGGISTDAWQTSVPTAGTKTIAHGDLVAVAIQMTARGGADSVVAVASATEVAIHRPTVTSYTGAAYAAVSAVPNVLVTFSDGAIGHLFAADVFSTQTTRTFSSGSATKEYGQLYSLPFPTKVYGLFGWINPTADCDVVLYSDPLGAPIAEKTLTMLSNHVSGATARRFFELFPAPYTVGARQPIAAIFKPGSFNVSAYFKTFDAAGHRVADVWGVNGYGISRASGAFANANSSLDHYHIGLLVGAFDYTPQTFAGFAITQDTGRTTTARMLGY